jgi:hypothetical protein
MCIFNFYGTGLWGLFSFRSGQVEGKRASQRSFLFIIIIINFYVIKLFELLVI